MSENEEKVVVEEREKSDEEILFPEISPQEPPQSPHQLKSLGGQT